MIEKFEDIEAWKKARELTRLVYTFSNQGAFSKDFGLRDQIRRASVSIMSNIAEGFNRNGKKEFIQFLAIAKGSAAEVQSQLYVALDNNYVNESDFQSAYDIVVSIQKMIGSFINYLQKSAKN